MKLMSPGSSIGAAHPVFSGGGEEGNKEGEGRNYMMEKVENMSIASPSRPSCQRSQHAT